MAAERMDRKFEIGVSGELMPIVYSTNPNLSPEAVYRIKDFLAADLKIFVEAHTVDLVPSDIIRVWTPNGPRFRLSPEKSAQLYSISLGVDRFINLTLWQMNPFVPANGRLRYEPYHYPELYTAFQMKEPPKDLPPADTNHDAANNFLTALGTDSEVKAMANRQRQAIELGLTYVYELYANPSNSQMVRLENLTRLVLEDGLVNDLFVDTARSGELTASGLSDHVGQLDLMDVDHDLPRFMTVENGADNRSSSSVSLSSRTSTSSSNFLPTPPPFNPFNNPSPHPFNFVTFFDPLKSCLGGNDRNDGECGRKIQDSGG